MITGQIVMLLFTLLGGLALFIFGMNLMTEGLKRSLGPKLQRLLSKTTRNKYAGFALGSGLGSIIHSAPTIVMLLGFVNAGLMTLEQTIAPMLGANIGTTLSMQAVSFKINEYCYVAITSGLVVSLISQNPKFKDLGRSLLGFGLLFLGMNVMSQSIIPHKAVLSQYMQGIDGITLQGVIVGTLVSAALTAIWQSSGATIAITFAMITSGVFTQFSQVYPIVLGAHIGTCITALLSSIGTNIEARRSAISHLVFNVFNVVLAILLKPFFFFLIPLTSSDLLRQTANLHTIVMIFAAICILPIAYPYAKLIRKLIPSQTPAPESSHLDYQLMEYPERAIVAVIKELQRVTKVCSQSLYLTAHVLVSHFDKETVATIKRNETMVDDIKLAIREYLLSMTQKYLSRRQMIMSQHLNRCITDIERIGDHIDQLCDLSLKRHKSSNAFIDKDSFDQLFLLYEKAIRILSLVIDSLNPDHPNFQEAAATILKTRDEYIQCSIETKEKFMKKVESHEVSSIAALYYNESVTVLDRMLRHIKSIALAQKHDDFWIKHSKLNKKTKFIHTSSTSSQVNMTDYIEKLRSEEYI